VSNERNQQQQPKIVFHQLRLMVSPSLSFLFVCLYIL
jgi:hypothetical protein